MQSLVSAKDFMPAGSAGTCFGPRPPLEMEVSLNSLKGIRAVWEWAASCRRYRFPLRLTSIATGSEADRKGLKAGDTVLAMRERDAFVEVKATAYSSCPGTFVPDSVNAMLLRNSTCDLRIVRQQGPVCSHCGLFTVAESRDKGKFCLVCTHCGLIAQDALMSNEAGRRDYYNAHDGARAADEQQAGAVSAARPNSLPVFHAHASSTTEHAASARSTAPTEVFKQIDAVCACMALPREVCASAQRIATKLFAALSWQRKHARAPASALGAASVYCACDELGLHRTVKETLAGAPACEAKHLKSAIALLKRALPPLRSPLAPSALLAQACTALRLPLPLQHAALRALQEAPPPLALRHVPSSLVAAAIARASNLSPLQVAAATGTAASTIHNVVRAWEGAAPAHVWGVGLPDVVDVGGELLAPVGGGGGGGLGHVPPPPPPATAAEEHEEAPRREDTWGQEGTIIFHPECEMEAAAPCQQQQPPQQQGAESVKTEEEEEVGDGAGRRRDGESADAFAGAFAPFGDDEAWPTDNTAAEDAMDYSLDSDDWGELSDVIWQGGPDSEEDGGEGSVLDPPSVASPLARACESGARDEEAVSASPSMWGATDSDALPPTLEYLSSRRLSEIVGGEEEEEEEELAMLGEEAEEVDAPVGGMWEEERVAGYKRKREEEEEEEEERMHDGEQASDKTCPAAPLAAASAPEPSEASASGEAARGSTSSALAGLPSKGAMERQLRMQFAGAQGSFTMNDNSYRRLALFHQLLLDAEHAQELSISVASGSGGGGGRSAGWANCVVGFERVRVHQIAAFNARVRAMIHTDPEGVWKKVNGKKSSGLKLPTAPLYEVLRKIGVRPAGEREAGGAAGEEDRFWRGEWVYKPETMTWKTVERMHRGHEYSPSMTSAVRKKATKARA